jgi:hypothetical protein
MRRKKDDKRVLRRGNGRNNKRNRRTPNLSFNNRNSPAIQHNQKKRSGKTVLLVIIVLFAFIIGAGIGVLLSFDDGTVDEKNETHYENVTVEMTTNLNNTTDVVFDESDRVDFNENKSSGLLGVEQNPYYNYTGSEE